MKTISRRRLEVKTMAQRTGENTNELVKAHSNKDSERTESNIEEVSHCVEEIVSLERNEQNEVELGNNVDNVSGQMSALINGGNNGDMLKLLLHEIQKLGHIHNLIEKVDRVNENL